MRLDEYFDKNCIAVYRFARAAQVNPNTLYNILKGCDIKLSVAAKIKKATKGQVSCDDLAEMHGKPTKRKVANDE